jgi:uncharacterized membrane protein
VRLGNRLLLPALAIPVVTMIGATLLKDVRIDLRPLLDQKNLTLVSMGCGSLAHWRWPAGSRARRRCRACARRGAWSMR